MYDSALDSTFLCSAGYSPSSFFPQEKERENSNPREGGREVGKQNETPCFRQGTIFPGQEVSHLDLALIGPSIYWAKHIDILFGLHPYWTANSSITAKHNQTS